MTRREIRDKVFKILFAAEFNQPEDMLEQVELALDSELPGDEEDDPLLHISMADKDRSYVTEKVMDIISKKDKIDETISEISQGWKLARIGKEELAILRLGVYEIQYDKDIPNKVAINEAVELAKKYCEPSASGFVNALLAKLVVDEKDGDKEKDAD
jgi:N utilization substance protein B